MPTVMQPARMSAAARPKMRAADVAYDVLENLIVTLQLKPGVPVVEAELIEMTGLGRTPLREALMRMTTNGLIVQLPRRGLIISDIEAAGHISLLETRRVLERLIAASAARRASPPQRQDILRCGEEMVQAATKQELAFYMQADQALDHAVHSACRNPSAVAAVVPLVIKCRRFWYAYQHEGDVEQGARLHLKLAQSIVDGNEQAAVRDSDALMDYLESVTRKVIEG
ncbi:GntR family transcriptional regulator [Massilia sp. W12]|uniref:GntR family transcriptional regulator n=1 Tax=Massilia sp. W12 TaxID=3126507 RepID=UPI0030CB9C9E